MPDILLSEYRAKIDEFSRQFGCDPPSADSPDDRTWTAPLGGLRAAIRLTGVSSRETKWICMKPKLQATISISGDGLVVSVILTDAQLTLQKALSCLALLHDTNVWIADCPCSRCSGRGTIRGSVCPTCEGTGKRQEKE